MPYKEDHEAFVSGHHGTSPVTVAIIVTIFLVAILCRDVISLLWTRKRPDGYWSALLRDFVLLVLPLQLEVTVASGYIVHLLVTLLALSALNIYIFLSQSEIKTVQKHVNLLQVPMGLRRIITYYRASVMVSTAFTILAVDFAIFPRSFAKAETYGTGLMDIGVGCFIVSNAVVAPEARGKVTQHRISSIVKSVRSSVPLVVLGVGRVLATKGIDYQEHVTEYGTHWNFFFTLAVVKVFSTVFFCLVPTMLWRVQILCVIAGYQYLLSSAGLREYLLAGSDGAGGRNGLIDANREGLASSLGYLAIYLMGVQLGKFIMTKREVVKDWLIALLQVALVTVVSCLLLQLSETYIEPVSRRFANLSYFCWMMAFNAYLLLVLLVLDIIVTLLKHLKATTAKKTDKKVEMSPSPTDWKHCLLTAVNYNGLFYFLLANVMTGVVNVSMRTIYVPPLQAFLVLSLYMLTICGITSFLQYKKISLKFW